MTHLLQSFVDALTSADFIQLALVGGALLMARCGCSHCQDDSNDEEDEDDLSDEADLSFNLTKDQLEEYNATVKETDDRIAELTAAIEEDSAERREQEEELVQLYLARAARKQEEEEYESAEEDYGAAFDLLNAHTEIYGESLETLKQTAAARLNYGILLNDSGELEDADEQYALAIDANKKLAALGDGEAKLDLIGLQLNRASIAYERGDEAESVNMIDETIEDFQRLADSDPNGNAEALYYLAKAYSTKSDFLRGSLEDEDDADAPGAAESREACKKAVDVYRSLVNAGYTNYKRDFSETLVKYVSILPQRSKEDAQEALAALEEACGAYQAVYKRQQILTQSSKTPDMYVELMNMSVDYFDMLMQRGELLLKADRKADAAALYDAVVRDFDQFAESDELPLMEGIAIAYQRRSTLRKDKLSAKQLIADLTKAIDLQTQIAESLIGTLKEDDEDDHERGCCGGHDHEGCGCGGHDHKGCGCGGRDHEGCGCGGHDHEGCGCGGHDHEGCGCGGHDHEGCGCGGHDHEGCGCGCCGGGDTERKFLIERWVNDNFRALTECYYERIAAHLENRDSTSALADCLAAETLEKAYRAVLRDDETLDMEFAREIRTIKKAL